VKTASIEMGRETALRATPGWDRGVWSEGGGGGRERKVKGKQNDERKRFQKGNLSGWASEDIRGFNEMLVWKEQA
jgi:hypothetical protein